MLCEKSYVNDKLPFTNTDRHCELTGDTCLYDQPDKSICPVYDKWLRKRTGDKNEL